MLSNTIRTLPYDSQQQLGSNVRFYTKQLVSTLRTLNNQCSNWCFSQFVGACRKSHIRGQRPCAGMPLRRIWLDLQNSIGTLRAHKKWNVPHGNGKCVSRKLAIAVAHPDHLANAALCISGEETCVCLPIAMKKGNLRRWPLRRLRIFPFFRFVVEPLQRFMRRLRRCPCFFFVILQNGSHVFQNATVSERWPLRRLPLRR